jgi:hypothetical protein
MHKQQASSIILLTLLLLAIPAVACASISVGVKNGDWIEYQVTITGTVPSDHNATWAKMEVTKIQENTISLNITTGFSDGTPLQEQITLNLETGSLGDDFIIPANLNIGDTFFDSRQGNITIAGTKQVTVAGAERTIIYASTLETSYYWDQATGVLVEAQTSLSDYDMTTKADQTNMWQPQIRELDPVIMYAFVISVAVIAVSAIVLLFLRRKKHGASA